jgi:cell division protein FtsQ
MLEAEPLLRSRVSAAVRVSERRWNLRIDDRVDVKLPAENPEYAWAKLADMEKSHGVLQRDIVVVDMRLPDRLVVQLAPGTEPRPKGQEKAT